MENSEFLWILLITSLGVIGIIIIFQVLKSIMDLVIKAIGATIFFGICMIIFDLDDLSNTATDPYIPGPEVTNQEVLEEVNPQKKPYEPSNFSSRVDTALIHVNSIGFSSFKNTKKLAHQQDSQQHLNPPSEEVSQSSTSETFSELTLSSSETIPTLPLLNCPGLKIPNGYHVLAEHFLSLEENAIARVQQLRSAGFSRATYFWSPCYQTDVGGEFFVVTITRPCRSRKTIAEKKKELLSKAKENRFELNTIRLVKVFN